MTRSLRTPTAIRLESGRKLRSALAYAPGGAIALLPKGSIYCSQFAGLPYAGKEIEDLTAILPNSVTLFDQDFSRAAVLPRLRQHSIIHFATHAAFIPGAPEESFILLGDGDRVTLSEIQNWSLQNVDLVVLSACETGVGGLGNGAEILGLGYQFQRARARAAIASLWQDDWGTQALMTEFYSALQQGQSKAKALQTAQQAMITHNFSATADKRAGIAVEGIKELAIHQTENDSSGLAHPYYWAPFILIGNGL